MCVMWFYGGEAGGEGGSSRSRCEPSGLSEDNGQTQTKALVTRGTEGRRYRSVFSTLNLRIVLFEPTSTCDFCNSLLRSPAPLPRGGKCSSVSPGCVGTTAFLGMWLSTPPLRRDSGNFKCPGRGLLSTGRTVCGAVTKGVRQQDEGTPQGEGTGAGGSGPGLRAQPDHLLRGTYCPGPSLPLGREGTTAPISQVPIGGFNKKTDEAITEGCCKKACSSPGHRGGSRWGK